MFGSVESCLVLGEITGMAQPCDPVLYVEKRIGDLTRHHVTSSDWVTAISMSAFLAPAFLRTEGVGSMAHNTAYFVVLIDLLDLVLGDVDHGNIYVLAREVPRDGGTDLSGSADDDFHGNLWLIEHPLGVIGGANHRAGRDETPISMRSLQTDCVR